MSIFSMSAPHRPHAYGILLLTWLLVIGFLCGCSPSAELPIGSQTVLEAMCQAEPRLPVGMVRIRTLSQGGDTSPDFLNDTLFSALYGSDCLSWFEPSLNADGTVGAPLIDDVAIFISAVQHPCELAVFRCTDPTGTVAAAKQCRRRLDLVRRAWHGTDEEMYCGRGSVEVSGNYVLLVIASDPEAVLNAAKRAIS